jgi:hypothetical protein
MTSLRSWTTVLLMGSLAFALGVTAADGPRTNRLAVRHPADFRALPGPARDQALAYIVQLSRVFSIIGTSGLARPTTREQALKETAAALTPLAPVGERARQAHAAGLDVQAALAYLGTCLEQSKPFDSESYNPLLRLRADQDKDPAALSAGVMELLIDYAQLVAPDEYLKLVEAGQLPRADSLR